VEGLRCRVFRLAAPRMWERLKFWLDKQGRCHPEWEEEFRRVRAEWHGTEMAVWLAAASDFGHPAAESAIEALISG
jgi:hypothetical protein